MKIAVFTEGSSTMHCTAKGKTREEIVQQSKNREPEVGDFSKQIPTKGSVQKLQKWKQQGAGIVYITSRTKKEEISCVLQTLKDYKFPNGKLYFRKKGQNYADVVREINPDILIEDDCESIGGFKETIGYQLGKQTKIKVITVPEFSGLWYLPDKIKELISYKS